MSRRFIQLLLIGALAVIPIGCEPAPVVDEDGDAETTVIEEGDVDVDPVEPVIPPPDTDSDVNVDVGGEKGVDVDVSGESEGASETDPNP